MSFQVCTGATMTCSFGASPSSLVAMQHMVMTNQVPDATIMDNMPVANIPPFGMCSSLANPAVAAATTAASGVLTPQPCVPVTPAPWVPGKPTILIGYLPALDDTSKLMCTWGGVIQFVLPGEFTVMEP